MTDPDNDWEEGDYDDVLGGCFHWSYETDFIDGRATCDDCGHSWYLTEAEYRAESERFAQFHADMDRLNRVEWWRDLWARVSSPFRRRKPALVNDDDLPF